MLFMKQHWRTFFLVWKYSSVSSEPVITQAFDEEYWHISIKQENFLGLIPLPIIYNNKADSQHI